MHNFFDHQDRARKNTHYLIFLFGCAIAFTVIAIYAFFIFVSKTQNATAPVWQPDYFLMVGVAVCCIVSFGSFAKAANLKGGGAVVARSLGGQLVSGQTDDVQERQLLNVVEEMAIAAGVAVPEVYLIPQASINSFAAGLTPNDAVIGVTRGCATLLNREQLQGVIGHEFSHIVNGDMALNLKLISVVHGLLLIHLMGRELAFNSCRIRSGDDKAKAGLLIFGLFVMIVGGISWIFGQLIKSAVARQREYLADAGAVQFTRNAQGIVDALRIVSQQTASPRLLSASAESASHLFFNDISLLGSISSHVFSTHPPIAQRIRRLGVAASTVPASPSVAPTSSHIALQSQSAIAGFVAGANNASVASSATLASHSASLAATASATSAAGSVAAGAVAQAEATSVVLSPDSAVNQIGTVTPDHLAQSQALLKGIPSELMAATRSRIGATSIIYGLLLSADELVRSHQRDSIAKNSAPAVLIKIDRLLPLLESVPVRSRLPLLELCIPSLKTLPPAAVAQLFAQVKFLIQSTGKLSLSAFALQLLLQYRLASHFRSPASAPHLHSHLDTLWPACWTLISALAQSGHSDAVDADYAFRNGLSQLPGIRSQTIPPMPNSSLHDVSKALRQLRATTPKLKQAIADACAHTVLTDGRATDRETELLRAILIALGCPIPPFLNA